MATLSSAASAVNSNLSTALIPYAAARRELRLTRYVCDKHIKAGRLRTVVAGRNLFIVAEDIANLGRELHAQELAQRHAGQFDSLSWVERCRIHRLPLPPALGRRRAHVLCVQHCYREVFALMGRRCPVEQAATVVLKVRLHRKAAAWPRPRVKTGRLFARVCRFARHRRQPFANILRAARPECFMAERRG